NAQSRIPARSKINQTIDWNSGLCQAARRLLLEFRMPDEPHLLFDVRSAVAVLTFNRPARYNSMSAELLDGFEKSLDEIERRDDVRAVLIRAVGKHFCTGADIDIVLGCVASGEKSVDEWLRRGQQLFRRVEALPMPTVVAIQGLCMAGGLELMLACDIV